MKEKILAQVCFAKNISNFVPVMEQDFKFDLAIIAALRDWLYSNKYLMEGVRYADRLIVWERDGLKIDLAMMNDTYIRKFITPSMEKYCDKMLVIISKVISEFLADYNFPSINLEVLFVYYGIHRGIHIRIDPSLKFNNLKIAKR